MNKDLVIGIVIGFAAAGAFLLLINIVTAALL